MPMPAIPPADRVCREASSEALAIALEPDVIRVAIAATIRLPATAAARATARDRDRAAHHQHGRPAQLQARAGEVAGEVADRGRGADHAQHGQLGPPVGVVRLGDERRVQEQEADHHLDGAVTPQRGDDVAAQRLSQCSADLLDLLRASFARCGRCPGGSSTWPAPHPRSPRPSAESASTGTAPASVTATTTNNAPGQLEQVGADELDACGDGTADDGAAEQTEHRQPGIDPHQVDGRRHHPAVSPRCAAR